MSYQIMAYEKDEIVHLLQHIRYYLKDLEAAGGWIDDIDNCLEILGVPRAE